MNEKCSHVYSPGDGSCMVVVDHATVHASMNDLHIEATGVQNFWQFWQFWKSHYSFPVTVTSSQKGQEHYTILFNYFSSALRILHDCTGEPVLLKQNFLKGWSFYTEKSTKIGEMEYAILKGDWQLLDCCHNTTILFRLLKRSVPAISYQATNIQPFDIRLLIGLMALELINSLGFYDSPG